MSTKNLLHAGLLIGLVILLTCAPGCDDDDDDDNSQKSDSPIVGSWTIERQVVVGQGVNGDIVEKSVRFSDDYNGYTKVKRVTYFPDGSSTETYESTFTWSLKPDSVLCNLFSLEPIIGARMAYTVTSDSLHLDYHRTQGDSTVQLQEAYFPTPSE